MAKKQTRGKGEGTVYQRKDGRWVCEITLEDHSRKQFYCKTKKEALEKRRIALNELVEGVLATGPQRTLKDYLEQWLEDVCKPPALRVSSYVAYEGWVRNHIVPALGHVQLQKLTSQQVQSLCSKMSKDGYAPKTVKLVHGVLHKALDNAVRWRLVSRNVADAVTLPRIPKRHADVLTLEQARAFVDMVHEHRLEMLFTLELVTGMRRGELLALRWSDVDFQSRVIFVRRTVDYIVKYGYVENEAKTESGVRRLLLPSFVFEKLEKHRTGQLEQRQKVGSSWQNRDLVFCNLTGGYIAPANLLNTFSKLLKEAGLSHMRFHDLRHSVFTLLLSMGVDPRSIQEFAGHKDITTTLGIYGHVLPVMQQGIVDKLDDMYGEGS